MNLKIYSLGILALFFIGCAQPGKESQKPSEKDFARAEDLQRAGRYEMAIEKFELVRNKYPLSEEALEAELKIADTYFLQQNYIEALSGYQVFKELHPRSRHLPYVQYKIALSHFKQVPSTADRDLTPCNKAIEAFQELQSLHPNSPYAKESEERIKECRRKLAEKEFYVGNFYFKQEHYKSAAQRFESILTTYPGLNFDEEALYYLGVSLFNLKEYPQAQTKFKELIKRFPDGEFRSESENYLSQIPQ